MFLTFSVHDENYSRNASCALNKIPLLVHHFTRVYHLPNSQCFDTSMVYSNTCISLLAFTIFNSVILVTIDVILPHE